MNCRGLIDKFLYDYHAGTLPFWRRLDFRIHLGLCGACRRYVRAYKTTVIVARQSMPQDPPKPLVDAILKSLNIQPPKDS
jgi:hypothetical protein